MKYAGMPMGMWALMKELGLYDLIKYPEPTKANGTV